MKQVIAATLLWFGLVVAANAAEVVEPAAGESFQIESVAHPGRLLRIEDAKSADGTPLVLYPRQAWRCMTWELQADGEASVRLKNLFTKKTVVPTSQPADKADQPLAVVQKPLAKKPAPAEMWKFLPIDGKEGLFHIVHSSSGLRLEASDDGRVVASKPSDAASQQWRLLKKPDHFTG